MPNTVLGKVTCTPKGAYVAATAYEVLDIVSYMGGSYMALKSVQGVTPSNDGTNWMMLAAKGDTGDTGEAAGFGTPTVTVDQTTGEASATVQVSGPDTAKIFAFAFSGIKGETGETGATGPQGPKGDPGTDVESISRTSGTGAPGTTDTYTMYASDGSIIGTFTVYNGANGTGTGDLMANGSVPMTGNLQMGGNRITNVGAPTAAADAVRQSDLEAVSNEVDGIISGETPITLPAATTAKRGGVIIGSGLSVTADGTVSANDQLPTGGTTGQILTKTEDGEAWSNPPDTGVTTFNGRTGAVSPQTGDYTAAMVGAVPTSRTVNGQALTRNITLDAGDVGAVPTSRTVNGKALSSNITLTADDVGATESQSGTYTLTTAGWTQSGSIYQQVVNAAFVQADSACVFVDPDLSTTDADSNAAILEAWALVANMGVAQGNGTVTLYASEVPGVNIPVNVGVA